MATVARQPQTCPEPLASAAGLRLPLPGTTAGREGAGLVAAPRLPLVARALPGPVCPASPPVRKEQPNGWQNGRSRSSFHESPANDDTLRTTRMSRRKRARLGYSPVRPGAWFNADDPHRPLPR